MNGLILSEITITPIGRGVVLAYAKVCLNSAIMIDDIKLIKADGKTFISMPGKRARAVCRNPGCEMTIECEMPYCPFCGGPAGFEPPETESGKRPRHFDNVHPVSAAAREWLKTAIILEYDKVVNRA